MDRDASQETPEAKAAPESPGVSREMRKQIRMAARQFERRGSIEDGQRLIELVSEIAGDVTEKAPAKKVSRKKKAAAKAPDVEPDVEE